MKRYLVTAATNFEMQAFEEHGVRLEHVQRSITGVGPMESGIRLTTVLSGAGDRILGVVNFGVAGGYVDTSGQAKSHLLDICLAQQEVLGDFGICMGERIDPFVGQDMGGDTLFFPDDGLTSRAAEVVRSLGVVVRTGPFVTVGCASGTLKRGSMLAERYGAVCENMEGAAVARACAAFRLPFVEIRCISNLVEDRDVSKWKLRQACSLAGKAAALVVSDLVSRLHEDEGKG